MDDSKAEVMPRFGTVTRLTVNAPNRYATTDTAHMFTMRWASTSLDTGLSHTCRKRLMNSQANAKIGQLLLYPIAKPKTKTRYRQLKPASHAMRLARAMSTPAMTA